VSTIRVKFAEQVLREIVVVIKAIVGCWEVKLKYTICLRAKIQLAIRLLLLGEWKLVGRALGNRRMLGDKSHSLPQLTVRVCWKPPSWTALLL
jgi:hypothetical protein